MPPNKRPLISKYPGGNVPAGQDDTDAIGPATIAVGNKVRITCFGAAMTHPGRVEIQIRTKLEVVAPLPPAPEKWRTLRCVIGPGDGHYENFQPIVGDGIVALRLVRYNDDGEARKIKAWVEGFRR